MLYILLLAIATIVALWMLTLVWGDWRFDRYVASELAQRLPIDLPPACVFLPCKGLDPELRATLEALCRQDYPRYEVICAVESADDPAFAVIQDTIRSAPPMSMRCVVATEPAVHCSQKICNLLAGIAAAPSEARVFAFLDSDAVPPAHWLRALSAPLTSPTIGAVTGFRWYVPDGTLVGLVRCAWNRLALSLLGGHSRNFCWGGSMALRRDVFESLEIAQRWRNVLSEDFEVTRAMHEAKLKIHFSPWVLLPSHDHATWRGFWEFARRQLIITRICHPPFWLFSSTLTVLCAVTFWGLLLGNLATAAAGRDHLATVGWLLFAAVYALGAVHGLLRQHAVARMLPDPAQRRGAWAADVVGGPLIILVNLALVVASGTSNRFWWRGKRYVMRAIDRVEIIDRRDDATGTAVGTSREKSRGGRHALRVALLVTDHERGGAPLRLLRLARGLRAAGVEVLAGCLAGEGPMTAEFQRAGARTFACDACCSTDWTAILRLRRHVRRLQPDLVHATLFHANVAAQLALRGLGIPLLTSTATIEVERGWHLWAERLFAGWDDGRTVNSAAVAEHVCARLGCRPSAVHVIPPATTLVEPPPRAQAREAYSIPRGCFVVLWYGRLDPVKRLPIVVGCARIMAGENVVFLIAGDGPERPRIERLIRSLGLEDRVRLLGWQTDVAALLATADALLFPSRTEGMPNTVLEAMAAGVPVVGSDIPALRELAGDEGRLTLVKQDCIPAYVAALRRFQDDPQAATRQARLAAEWVARNGSIDRSVGATLDVYRRVLQNRKPRW